ncbi:MAG: hypothetical protein KF884_04400 [Fimbriimonadaceae bacterium]|nr:hypothetical protein [Fimbriimonadaceae bacterium]QYK59331.1 MAG: hypothetical protein KF884_04400 [Fimbriimonadaceae bacterium]
MLSEALTRLEGSHWRFIVTWNTDQLPFVGPDVVVVLLGDEWSRVPTYLESVHAVFKTMNSVHEVPDLRNLSGLQQAVEAVKSVRNKTFKVLTGQGSRGRDLSRLFSLPLGYYKQVEIPIVPIEKRNIDVFFSGHIGQLPSLIRPRTLRPKEIARHEMYQIVNHIRKERSDLVVHVEPQAEFGTGLSPEMYSRKLMDSKICLSPRGSHPETLRLYEGARAGCVVIANRLPNAWYYKDSPVIQVDRWSEAASPIFSLLADREALVRTHQETLAWYREVVSPEAIGKYIADQVAALPRLGNV